MSYRVWVKCLQCGYGNQSPTILDKACNERSTCPGCKSLWQDSQIVAKVNFPEKAVDHIIWM